MTNSESPNLSLVLPFSDIRDIDISDLYLGNKHDILEERGNTNFRKNMLKLVNGFSRNNYTCSYYLVDSINNIANTHLPNCLKILHQNIVSFSKNGTKLSVELSCLNFKFDIICLTEIRENNVGLFEKEFPNYHIFLDNPQQAQGGVAVLLRKNKFEQISELDSNINFNLANNCSCNTCQIENKWLSFKINNQEIVLGGIYRHPSRGSISCFNHNLKNTLDIINRKSISIILGDTNINLINENNEDVDTYLNSLISHNYIPLITLPTRLTSHSTTLIDHIFIRLPLRMTQNKCSSGNLLTEYSDHLPNFTLIDINTPPLKDRPYVRVFSETNKKHFTDNILNERDLINDDDLTDTHDAYDILSDNFLKLYNKYFPLRRVSKKEQKDKPYITDEIKNEIALKNKLHKKYLNNPSERNETAWKEQRKKTNTCITRAEESYYKTILRDHNNNSRNLWKTFGKIINKNKIKHKRCITLNINNVIINDTQKVTESFNDFFCEVGEKLANKFSTGNNTQFRNYLSNPAPQSMFLRHILPCEIEDVITNLKSSHSAGHDEFSSKFIKLSSPILVPALVKIFNLAIDTGTYPNKLKIAKVLPVYKKGSQTSINNYRPISLLSTINKIFEKILYSRLINYIDKFQLLYKYQYGFRKKHSTEQSLIEFIDQIRLSMDKQEMTCGIFIDLSKAFDTVNHQILIDKLDHYGIRGKPLELFKSYLSNRTQYVQIDNIKSKTKPITCGVPQGSVLGPLLFLLFINDIPNCCTSGNFRIFADDTNVFYKCKNTNEIVEIGKNIMTSLNDWFRANKMTLNTDKTSFTIFKSNRLTIPNLPTQIEFLNTKIQRSSQIKFLGLTLDENLSWEYHINNVCNKLKSLFHIFYNIREYLRNQDIITLYYTLIYSRIKYGISLYGQAAENKIKKVQILQNQLLKVITKKPFRYNTDILHNELEILKVKEISFQEILIFVHNYFTNSLPTVFDNYFLHFNHNYNTRNAALSFRQEAHHTQMAAQSVKILGVKLWNRLENSLKTIPNRKRFRNKLKNCFLQGFCNNLSL